MNITELNINIGQAINWNGQWGCLMDFNEEEITLEVMGETFTVSPDEFADQNPALVIGVNGERTIKVDWDDDGAEMPEEITIPNFIPDEDVADYLSDTYGFCVNSWYNI